METYGDIVQYKLGPYENVMITHPDYIKHVLQKNFSNYKKANFYLMKEVLGQGLVTSEGEFWRQQRKLIQPAFHKHRISRFAEIMVKVCHKLVHEWSRKEDQVIDICAEMKKLTMAIVSLVIFNKDLSHSSSKLGTAINTGLRLGDSMIRLPPWIDARGTMSFNQNLSIVKKTVLNIISERRKTPGETSNLMDMLIAAQDEETGVGMSDQQLFDEIITLFIAAHETTFHGLVWTFYLLDKYPEMEANLFGELEKYPFEFQPELGDVSNLRYTTATIKESLRMFPPFWGIGREVVQNDQINGYAIPSGMVVNIPIYQMHYHPKYWTDPGLTYICFQERKTLLNHHRLTLKYLLIA